MALFGKDTPPTQPQSPPARAPHLLGLPQTDLPPANWRNQPNEARAAPTESRLTVGPNIKLKGVEIEDCDTLVVEGYVEASMDSRVIEISERGVYKGKVEIDTAIVRGRFEGELTARERLVVHASGNVNGKIRYGRLSIEEGGRVHGDLDEIGAPETPSRNRVSVEKSVAKSAADPDPSAAGDSAAD